jgi:hypothetical protein
MIENSKVWGFLTKTPKNKNYASFNQQHQQTH